jgi:hypothetical protein
VVGERERVNGVKGEGVLCSRKKTAGGAVLRSTFYFIILLNKLLFNV